jgi:hypothetical protein
MEPFNLRVVLAVLLCALLASACNVRDMLDAAEQPAYDELLTLEAQAAAEVEKLEEQVEQEPTNGAALEALTDARANLAALSAEINAVEDRAIKERYGPIWAGVAGLPVIGPYMQALGPLAGSFLIPLLSRRGRRHYKSAVRNVTPWVPVGGEKGVALADAALDVLRALGILHSTPESAKAAEAPTPA